jgi:hypothetical protein
MSSHDMTEWMRVREIHTQKNRLCIQNEWERDSNECSESQLPLVYLRYKF